MLDVSKLHKVASKSHGWCLLASVAILLAGCASSPGLSDGAGGAAGGPPNIDQLPAAEPVVEAPIPGANQPYTVLGRSYVPLSGDPVFRQSGLASWYGVKYQGRRTASGEPYDMYKLTAAHPTLPIPSYARVRHVATGREVIVRVNDRGPFHSEHIIDLSYNAARRLGILEGKDARIELDRLTNQEIRTGSWRNPDLSGLSTAAAPASILAGGPSDPVPVAAQVKVAEPVRVALAPLSAAPSSKPPVLQFAQPTPGYWVQLGAFRYLDGAERFQRQVAGQVNSMASRLSLFNENSLYRLQAGPYPTREAASEAARMAGDALQLVPMIVQRR